MCAHWRIEGGGQGGFAPPPPQKKKKWLRWSKLEVANQQGVVKSRSQTKRVYSKLKVVFEFPTIPIICLINIEKSYKICTFLKKSCMNFQNFPENVINDLYILCFQNNCTLLN